MMAKITVRLFSLLLLVLAAVPKTNGQSANSKSLSPKGGLEVRPQQEGLRYHERSKYKNPKELLYGRDPKEVSAILERLPESVLLIAESSLDENEPEEKEELVACENEMLFAYRKYQMKCSKKNEKVSNEDFKDIWESKYKDCYGAYAKFMPRIDIDLEGIPGKVSWKIDGLKAEVLDVSKVMGSDMAPRISGGNLVLPDEVGTHHFPHPECEGKLVSANNRLSLRLGSYHYGKVTIGEVPNRKRFCLRIGINTHKVNSTEKDTFWTEWFFVDI